MKFLNCIFKKKAPQVSPEVLKLREIAAYLHQRSEFLRQEGLNAHRQDPMRKKFEPSEDNSQEFTDAGSLTMRINFLTQQIGDRMRERQRLDDINRARSYLHPRDNVATLIRHLELHIHSEALKSTHWLAPSDESDRDTPGVVAEGRREWNSRLHLAEIVLKLPNLNMGSLRISKEHGINAVVMDNYVLTPSETLGILIGVPVWFANLMMNPDPDHPHRSERRRDHADEYVSLLYGVPINEVKAKHVLPILKRMMDGEHPEVIREVEYTKFR